MLADLLRFMRMPLFAACLLAGCSSEPTQPPLPPPLTFNVSTQTQTNNGGLFYIVARSVNEKQFMLETYQDIAGKTFADPPDSTVLGVFSIVPGVDQECAITPPAQGSVALYFLLTQPDSQWKQLLSPPFANVYRTNLTAAGQIEISEQKSWYSLF